MKKRPNLLFVFSDQHRQCSLGCYGNNQIISPHFDRLAVDGIKFEHCIANFPVCVPMRGSLLTGLYAWRHRAISNDLAIDPATPSIADRLNAANYHTGYIGKWHLGGIPRDQAITLDRRLGFTEWKVANCNHTYNRGYYYDELDQCHQMQQFQSVGETDLAIDFIRRNHVSPEPWALFLAWSPPHEPFNAVPPEFLAMYDPATLQLRPNVPADWADETRRWTQGYYGLITLLDQQMGRLRATLAELGIDEDTIIVYTSDHGDMLGSHRLRHKQLPHEESIAVPLLIAWPGHLQPGSRSGLIGLIDLPVTLASFLDIDWPGVDGRDGSAMLTGNDTPDDHEVLIADLIPCHQAEDRHGSEWIGLRTMRHTFSRDGSGHVQFLYDNQSDPYQQYNLADTSTVRELQAALNARLDRKLEQCAYRFRPWRQMVREDGYLKDWNASQQHFHRKELES